MLGVVIEVVEGPLKHTNGYSVKVKAMNPDGKVFDYQFIKNHKADAEIIIPGWSWEMKFKRKNWI